MRRYRSDNPSAGRAAGAFLALIAVFAASGLLGYYVVGPKLLDAGSAGAPAARQAPADEAPPPVPSPLAQSPADKTRLTVDISEEKGGSSDGPGSAERSHQTSAPRARPSTAPVPAASGSTAAPEQAKKPAPEAKGKAEDVQRAATPQQKAKPTAPAPSPRTQPTTQPSKPAAATARPSDSAAAPGPLYRVQVGVYVEQSRAQQVADALKAKGQVAHVASTTVNGKTAWRVQAGLFKERGNADRLAQKLKGEGHVSTVVAQQERP